MNIAKREKMIKINKIFMLSITVSLLTTPVFAVKATDIFSSGINTTLNANSAKNDISGQGLVIGERDIALGGGSIDNNPVQCENAGVTVDCTVDGKDRTEAPYAVIDAMWPVFDDTIHPTIEINGNSGTSTVNGVTTALTPPFTLEPGIYRKIDTSKAGSVPGQLILNPGIYWVDEYISGSGSEVIPGGTDGTVAMIVKSNIDFTSSLNNCKKDTNGNNVPYSTPNRYTFYSEDPTPNFSSACISGYIYFRHGNFNLQSEIWGAISAPSIQIQNAGIIHVDLEHVIFTDFGGVYETGPQQTAGWHIVAAPVEVNATNPVTVEDFFGNDFNTSTFRTDWRVYQRDYNDIDHSVYYTELDSLTDNLEKSRGYWIGTKKDANMTVLGLKPVVWQYDIPGCTSVNGCYRYTLKSCTDGDTDPYLYNLVGYPGATKADWADYRVEVDGNGTYMTPSEANVAHIINKQIWYYDSTGNTAQVLSGEYGTCDDGILPCDRPDYFQGHWVEVNCTNSIGKTIDLIIPNGK
jgi:hypothetical protein